MSMKRARRASSSSKGSQAEGSLGFGTPGAGQKSWAEIMEGKPDAAFKPYAMTSVYAREDLILHPKFGKGVVTLVEGSRVEVLFEEGSKKLVHAGT